MPIPKKNFYVVCAEGFIAPNPLPDHFPTNPPPTISSTGFKFGFSLSPNNSLEGDYGTSEEEITPDGNLWVVYMIRASGGAYRTLLNPGTSYHDTPIDYSGNNADELVVNRQLSNNRDTVVLSNPNTAGNPNNPIDIRFKLAITYNGHDYLWDPQIKNNGSGN